jgi:uncharacterized membrane protein
MKTNLSNNFKGLRDSAKEYISLKLDLARLSVLEKLTKISVFLTVLLAFILAGTLLFLFSTTVFVVWYGNNYGDYISALWIVIGIVFLLAVLFYFFRNAVVTTFFLKTYSKILIDDDEDDD